MASAHPLSAPGGNSSLQLFQVPVTDMSIVSSKWLDYEPVQTGTNPIEFVIKSLKDYIDINKTELRLVVKITKQDGSATGEGKKYTLVNNTLHSIVKQFTIKINETLVTEQSDTQAYNAYTQTLLNFTEQAKKSYLTKALYYKDTARHMDEVDNTADNNQGLVKRATFTNNGAEVGLVGVPLCDVFNMDKLLLDGLEIKVKVDQLLQRYQGLSKQIKSESTVKPTVVLPTPPATTPKVTQPPLTSQANITKQPPGKVLATPVATTRSKIPVSIETPPSPQEPAAHEWMMETPPDSVRKSVKRSQGENSISGKTKEQ